MGISIGLTKAYFDSKGLRYRVSDDEKALSLILGGLKNKGDIHIVVFFDGDDRSVAVRAFDLVKVPEGHVFVLSDDRQFMEDSREDGIGCIDLDDVVGVMEVRLLPAFAIFK